MMPGKIDLSHYKSANVHLVKTCPRCDGTGQAGFKESIIRWDRPKPDGHTYHSEWVYVEEDCGVCDATGEAVAIVPFDRFVESIMKDVQHAILDSMETSFGNARIAQGKDPV